MSKAEHKTKDSAMAAHLVKTGYWHGRRKTSPAPNSGGLTMVNEAGSSKNQRMVKARERYEEVANQARARRNAR